MVWAGWLYSQEWWRRELWRATSPPGTTFEQVSNRFRGQFSADANDYILQARSWERHNVGTTPGFDGDVERALRSIKVPVLYMPSETDLYFPVGDADSIAMGPYRRRCPQPRRCQIPEREYRPLPGRAVTFRGGGTNL
jgi:pimeloyl-ACP methyl ester carboxylesterase